MFSQFLYLGGYPGPQPAIWHGDFFLLGFYSYVLNETTVKNLYLEGPNIYPTISRTCGPPNIPSKISYNSFCNNALVLNIPSLNVNLSQSMCIDFLANSTNSDGATLYLESVVSTLGYLNDTDNACPYYFVQQVTNQYSYVLMEAGNERLLLH